MTNRILLPDISSYKQALLEPFLSFRTLKGILPVKESEDEPHYVASHRAVLFKVTLNGERYILKCFLCPEHLANARLMCEKTSDMQFPSLIKSHFFENEMLIFDKKGKSRHYDIVLIPVEKGVSLRKFIEESLFLDNRQALLPIVRELCRIVNQMISHRLFTDNFRLDNMLVSEDGSLVLTFLDHMRLLPEKEADRIPEAFYDPMSLITLFLWGMACEPLQLQQSDITCESTRQELMANRDRLIAILRKYPSLEKLCRAIETSDYSDIYFILKDLSHQTNPMDVTREVDPEKKEQKKIVHSALHRSKDLKRPLLQTYPENYIFLDQFHEGLAAVSRPGDQKCGFIDRNRNEVIPFIYDWAGDFTEGLAMVLQDGLYGLINRVGEQVVPIRYEDIEWFPQRNVAIVQRNGKFGLVDRIGREICPLKYYWIAPFGSHITKMQSENGKWGCIDTGGKEIIPCIYDEIELDDQGAKGKIAGYLNNEKKTILTFEIANYGF